MLPRREEYNPYAHVAALQNELEGGFRRFDALHKKVDWAAKQNRRRARTKLREAKREAARDAVLLEERRARVAKWRQRAARGGGAAGAGAGAAGGGAAGGGADVALQGGSVRDTDEALYAATPVHRRRYVRPDRPMRLHNPRPSTAPPRPSWRSPGDPMGPSSVASPARSHVGFSSGPGDRAAASGHDAATHRNAAVVGAGIGGGVPPDDPHASKHVSEAAKKLIKATDTDPTRKLLPQSRSDEQKQDQELLCEACGGLTVEVPPLPHGWQEFPPDADSAVPYFYNEGTGEVSWNPPPGSARVLLVVWSASQTTSRACRCEVKKAHKLAVTRGRWKLGMNRLSSRSLMGPSAASTASGDGRDGHGGGVRDGSGVGVAGSGPQRGGILGMGSRSSALL